MYDLSKKMLLFNIFQRVLKVKSQVSVLINVHRSQYFLVLVSPDAILEYDR